MMLTVVFPAYVYLKEMWGITLLTSNPRLNKEESDTRTTVLFCNKDLVRVQNMGGATGNI